MSTSEKEPGQKNLIQQKALPEQRCVKSVRFKPQKGVYAFVDTHPKSDPKHFAPSLAGLVVNQSFKGCAVVLQPNRPPMVGELVKIKLGPLQALLAEVRWFQTLDKNIYKIGLKFCE